MTETVEWNDAEAEKKLVAFRTAAIWLATEIGNGQMPDAEVQATATIISFIGRRCREIEAARPQKLFHRYAERAAIALEWMP